MSFRSILKKRYILCAYLILLLASQLVRRLGDRPPLHVDFPIAQLDGAFMAYRDLGQGEVVLLITGSPSKSFDLASLAAGLARHRRILVPDLPGFGKSQRFIPDYSFQAHAEYLRQFLEKLNVTRAHVVGYSQGGGVALWLWKLAPERVASLTMLSSIGVQELELLGNYELNHAIHGAQLAFFWALAELTPHFGFFDGYVLNKFYARNFYDSDQRPLRGFLEEYPGPMLILHAPDDVLVPVAAAKEHYRIVPQSELDLVTGNHVAALFEPQIVAAPMSDFFGRVERGAAATRTQADPARAALAAQPFDSQKIEKLAGLSLVIILALIALGTFISEDLACIGAGLMAAHGSISFPAAAFASFLGIFIGDLLLFWAGKYIGRPALRHRPFKWFFTEEDIEESARWFSERGPFVIVLSRFVPGSRLPTYFAAGLLHTSLWKFLFYFLVAGIVWAPLLVWLAMVLGGKLMAYLHAYKTLTIVSVIVVAAVLWMLFELVIPLFSFKGRRLLLSSWRRKTRWEFWPLWVFYPPVFAYCAWLALKHRGAGVFSACNPGIPASGFIGESKAQILTGLKDAGDAVARWAIANSPGDVRDFMRSNNLSYPVVLKPDVGQRGIGVGIARSGDDVSAYFQKPRRATIAQAYAPGVEFGVFYYRCPGQEKGRIFSITEKRAVEVVGDGVNDLEHLILKDDRAVCMASLFLRKHRRRLFDVPPAGEKIPLAELGTHCRGSVFLDGMWVNTPELEDAIDRISHAFDGFFFGRYDIRTPSVEDFKAGKNFKIIELNGVTSEATAIYSPGNRLIRGYRTLWAQWRLAFEIGAANRARGVKPWTAFQLARALVNYESSPEA